jgi:hypothetical protein
MLGPKLQQTYPEMSPLSNLSLRSHNSGGDGLVSVEKTGLSWSETTWFGLRPRLVCVLPRLAF